MTRHFRPIHVKLTSVFLAMILFCYSLPASAPAFAAGYSDVKKADWYYGYVTSLSNSGVISGYPDGTFRPAGNVTVGESLKIIMLAAGYAPQAATSEHWSGGYAAKAEADRLLSASETSDLNIPITRLTAARLAAKAAGVSGSGAKSSFSDVTDGCVTALYEHGVLEGETVNGARIFRPNDTISRAELCAVAHRLRGIAGSDPGIMSFANQTFAVLDGVPRNSYTASAFYTENGIPGYSSDGVTARLGVDVSYFQGAIDWQKVAASGVDFAMIRVGGRGYGSGEIYDDKQFHANMRGALNAGLDVGVYFFSQAISVSEALEEAAYVLNQIRGYNVTYPVVFDWENIPNDTARTDSLDSYTLGRCAKVFCEAVKAAGYRPMVYFNQYIGYIKYDLSHISEYDFWLAEYNTTAPSFKYDFAMWQYTASGTVPGISGKVDMNLHFAKTPA